VGMEDISRERILTGSCHCKVKVSKAIPVTGRGGLQGHPTLARQLVNRWWLDCQPYFTPRNIL
jgi:hypothetical protein